MPKVGWEFVTWTGRAALCAIPPCTHEVNAGYVRVDRPYPVIGDPVVCMDCWFKIQLGVDPDPDATVPEWEEERRRAQNNPDA